MYYFFIHFLNERKCFSVKSELLFVGGQAVRCVYKSPTMFGH